MTPSPLLWLLILQASLRPAENRAHATEDGRDYEVVRPVRLHAVRRRHAENPRPEVVRYAMKVGGRDLELELERNDELLTKDYSETTYLEDGTPVTTSPDHIDHCYYQGRVSNDGASSASISTCDGLRGYFQTSAQRYLIEPLTGDDEGDHAVSTFIPEESEPSVCGVTNVTWGDDWEPSTSRSRSRSGTVSIVQQQKYVELFLVADQRQFEMMNKDQTALRKRMFDIINYVNLAFKPLKTFIALVGLEVWTNGDLSAVTPPAGSTLGEFTKWKNSDLVLRKPHDAAFLISGINFEGETVGLAFVGTMCQRMSTVSFSWKIPSDFSSCSVSRYDKFLRSRTPDCILHKPDYKTLVAPADCGNGFVEEGEECDCGTVEECTNPCCDAKTCRLSEGSQCAEGECCDQCRLSPRSKECRGKRYGCDLAEFCDGKSFTCPQDVFAANGIPCDGDLGYCYNGECPQRPNQCIKMYGAGAEEAPKFCYKQNTRGKYYAFCKRPSNKEYIGCNKEDVYCGKLFCRSGKTYPNYGRMLKLGSCKGAFFQDHTEDYGQVDAGTKCGDGKVCSDNECVDLVTSYRSSGCSEGCPGHAVCNHKGACQCEPGWMPPSCTSAEDTSRSLSPSTTAGISLAVLLVALGVFLAMIGIFWKKRKAARTQTEEVSVDPSQNHLGKAMPEHQTRPKGAPPPTPPAGNAPKPTNYPAAPKALEPEPPLPRA